MGSTGDEFAPDLEKMSRSLHHRGPDSNGLWLDLDAGIGFAHQRLAIVDISEAGHQPMISPSGRFVLSYNGEIYNHQQLRNELMGQFHDIGWRGHSDTETLIVAIERWGLSATVDKLVGMFAFAVWDKKERRLHLCRDRMGEKPLYYGFQNGRSQSSGSVKRFVFTSELKALSLPGFQRNICKDALVLYFRYHYIPAPYSIYEGIFKLEPGCILTLAPGDSEPRIRRYWSPVAAYRKAQSRQFPGSLDEATNEVARLLQLSVEGQMVADVPLGAFLSGGIDSSTIVSLMQRAQSTKINTFSIGFTDDNYNEAPFARQIADRLGTDHTEFYLTDQDVEEMIPQLPRLLDEPFADSSLLPTFAVSQLARQAVTVSLSGDGGDELFGGYTRYVTAAQAMRVRERLGKTGRRMSSALLNSPLLGMDRTGRPALPLQLNRFAPTRKLGTVLYALSQPSDSMLYRSQVSFWRNPHTPVVNPGDPMCKFQDEQYWLTGTHPQDCVQMMDVNTFLPDDILFKVDRAAMSVSLETRVPMLDHRLMEFVWSLPFEYRGGTSVGTVDQKKILKDIVCRSVPREMIERPKKGFGVPIGKWIRGPLSNWAESLLSDTKLNQQGMLDPDVVKACWNDVKRNENSEAEFIWSILLLQQWLDNENLSL